MINVKNFCVLVVLSVLFQGTALGGPSQDKFSKIHKGILGSAYTGPRGLAAAGAALGEIEALIPAILLEQDHALTEAELREMLQRARAHLEAERQRIAALPARTPVTFNVPEPAPETEKEKEKENLPVSNRASSATPSEACSHRTGASCKSRKSAAATRTTLASDNIGGEEEIRATLVRLGLRDVRDAFNAKARLSPEIMTHFLDTINSEIDALMKLLNKKKKNKPAILAARMIILRLLAALEQVGGDPDELTNFYMLLNENVELSDILDKAGNFNPRTGGAKKPVSRGVNGEIHEWIRGIGVNVDSDTARRKLEEIAVERGVIFVVFGVRGGCWVELYRVGNAGAEVNIYLGHAETGYFVAGIGEVAPTIPGPAAAGSTPDLDALERELRDQNEINGYMLEELAGRYGVTIVVLDWQEGVWKEIQRLGTGPTVVYVYLNPKGGCTFKKNDKDPPPPPGGAAGGGSGGATTSSKRPRNSADSKSQPEEQRTTKGGRSEQHTSKRAENPMEQMLINSVPTAAKMFVGAAAFMHQVQQRISRLRF